jgi:membrane protein YqaA with SNARE-associated domain
VVNAVQQAIVFFQYALDISRVLRRLGGIGLLVLGLTDGSLIPLPGSMDALTLVLAARHNDLWFYYAVMATVGSTVGGSLTYRFALKHGKRKLIRRLGEAKTERLCRLFARWGFGAVAIPALLPPPFPIVPFLLAAGATHYPKEKFVSALAAGRTIRFTALAFLASLYGRRAVLRAAGLYRTLLMWALIPAGLIAISITLYWAFNRCLSTLAEREKSKVVAAIPTDDQ